MGFVAVTDINHGEEDGKVTKIARGETVEGLPDDVMNELYAAGSIVDEDDPDNPNNLEDEEGKVYATTPAMVEQALIAQMKSAASPSGETDKAALTQPNQDAPSDPAALLDATPAEKSTPTTSTAATTTKASTTTATKTADSSK